MTIDTAFGIYAVALGLVMAVLIGGFTLIFMELHRLDAKLDALPAEFRAQRAEVSAQTAALAGMIMAARS